MAPKTVVPLESDPKIFNNLAYSLGLSQSFEFTDIYSLTEKDLLAFIPRPIKAIILLFPISPEYEAFKNHQDSQLTPYTIPKDEKIYWFPQNIKNACGLFALLHTVCNVISDPERDVVKASKLDGFLKNLREKKTFEDRTLLIENLEFEYSTAAQDGQTDAPSADAEIDLHFISFVFNDKDGHVYELDGRRNGPVDLGKNKTNGDVLEDDAVIKRIQNYMIMANEGNQLNFSLMGLIG